MGEQVIAAAFLWKTATTGNAHQQSTSTSCDVSEGEWEMVQQNGNVTVVVEK